MREFLSGVSLWITICCWTAAVKWGSAVALWGGDSPGRGHHPPPVVRLWSGGEVFAIPNCLIVSIIGSNGHTLTRMRRVPLSSVNVDGIDVLTRCPLSCVPTRLPIPVKS